MLGICVMAKNRPNYLYVTLDSIFRMQGIEKYHVAVYFDGILSPEVRRENTRVVAEFPVKKVVFQTDRELLMFYSHMLPFEDMFSDGYDEVLLIAEDVIVRTDALLYLEGLARDAFSYDLYRANSRGSEEMLSYCSFRSFATMLSKASFEYMSRWFEAKLHRGHFWFGEQSNVRICEMGALEEICADGLWVVFAREHKTVERIPPKVSYVYHFGVRRCNIAPSEEVLELEQKMFAGERSGWLNNVLQLVPPYQEQDPGESLLIPSGFAYVGGVNKCKQKPS